MHFVRVKCITGGKDRWNIVQKMMRVIFVPGLDAGELRRFVLEVEDWEVLSIEKIKAELENKGSCEKESKKREQFMCSQQRSLQKEHSPCVTRADVPEAIWITFFGSGDVLLEVARPVSTKRNQLIKRTVREKVMGSEPSMVL